MDDPKNIGRYELVRRLGQGGMGSVYLARDPLIDRRVAVKLLDGTFDLTARQRFAREARSAGRLHHEHIVTVFDVGEDAGRPFIAMEYVEGETLAHLIAREPPVPLPELLAVIDDACAGLAYAHDAGVVHLDIKPENLMRTTAGRGKVLDFGISRVLETTETQTQSILGTLSYMSPEQLAGRPLDRRSDVYAMGCVLYEAVARRPAFDGPLGEVVLRIERGEYTPLDEAVPGTHPELVRMAKRSMALDPAHRHDDIHEFRRELAAVRREIGTDAPVGRPTTKVANAHAGPVLMDRPASRRRWRGAAALAALAIVIVAGALAAPWVSSRETVDGAAGQDAGAPAATADMNPSPSLPAVPAAATTPVAPNAGDGVSGEAATGGSGRQVLPPSGQQTTSERPTMSGTLSEAGAATRTEPPADSSPSTARVSTAAPPVAPQVPAALRGAPSPSNAAGRATIAAPVAGRAMDPTRLQPPEPTATNTSAGAPPAVTEPARAPSPEQSIRAALEAYAAAYRARDINALRRVYPGLSADDAAEISRAFNDARSYDMNVDVQSLQVTGVTATALCDVTHRFDSRIARVPDSTVRATFHLRRADDRWVIDRIVRTGAAK